MILSDICVSTVSSASHTNISASITPSVVPTAPSTSSSSSSQTSSKSANDVCSCCGTSLSGWNNMRRTLHINACKARKPVESGVNMCPICHRIFTSKQGLTLHKKKCGQTPVPIVLPSNTSNRLSTGSNASDCDFQRPAAPVRSAPTSVRKKWEGDEDMQTALAISLSLADEAKRRESQNKLDAKDLPLPTTLTLTSIQRDEILSTRVAAIFSDVGHSSSKPEQETNTGDDPIDLTCTASHLSGVYPASTLWRAGFTCLSGNEPYYVSALIPPLSPCQMSMHDKLMSLSQVPGRDKSRWSQVNKSLVDQDICMDSNDDCSSVSEITEPILTQGFFPSSPIRDCPTIPIESSTSTEAMPMETENPKSVDQTDLLKELRLSSEFVALSEHQKRLFAMINNASLSDLMIECQDNIFLWSHKFIFFVNTSSLDLENVQTLELTEYCVRTVIHLLVYLYTGAQWNWDHQVVALCTKLGFVLPTNQENVDETNLNDMKPTSLGQCSVDAETQTDLSTMDDPPIPDIIQSTDAITQEEPRDVNLSTGKLIEPTDFSDTLLQTSVDVFDSTVHETASPRNMEDHVVHSPPTSPIRSLTCISDDDMFDVIHCNDKLAAVVDDQATPAPLRKRLKLSHSSSFDSPSLHAIKPPFTDLFTQPTPLPTDTFSKHSAQDFGWSPSAGILAISTPPSTSTTVPFPSSPSRPAYHFPAEQVEMTPPPTSSVRKAKMLYSPLTPMPLYESMMTPHLKKSLAEFGVRPLGKKKAIILLKEIYRYTHQNKLAALTSNGQQAVAQPSSTTVSHRNKPNASKPINRVENSATDSETDQGDEFDRDFYDCPGALEESLLLMESENLDPDEPASCAEEIKSCTNTTKHESAENQVLHYLRTNEAVYENILLYEPLELDALHADIKASGIKIGVQRLMNILDEQCITFTMRSRNQAGHNRHQRGRKRNAAQATASQAM